MNTEHIEEFIKKFPIYQYAFITPQMLEYSPKVRTYCKRSCPNYAQSWSCPPAVGKLDKCREQCMKYSDILVFSTVSELKNYEDRALKISLQKEHEHLTELINNYLKDQGYLTYLLTSNKCMICPKCTFPRDFCKNPDSMYPCIESHGILVSDMMQLCNMDHYMGEGLQLLFSMIFIKDSGFAYIENKEEENNA